MPYLVSEACGSSRAARELLQSSPLESQAVGGGSSRVSARIFLWGSLYISSGYITPGHVAPKCGSWNWTFCAIPNGINLFLLVKVDSVDHN